MARQSCIVMSDAHQYYSGGNCPFVELNNEALSQNADETQALIVLPLDGDKIHPLKDAGSVKLAMSFELTAICSGTYRHMMESYSIYERVMENSTPSSLKMNYFQKVLMAGNKVR